VSSAAATFSTASAAAQPASLLPISSAMASNGRQFARRRFGKPGGISGLISASASAFIDAPAQNLPPQVLKGLAVEMIEVGDLLRRQLGLHCNNERAAQGGVGQIGALHPQCHGGKRREVLGLVGFVVAADGPLSLVQPLLTTLRRSALLLKVSSASSTMKDGFHFSMERNSAAPEISTDGKPRRTRKAGEIKQRGLAAVLSPASAPAGWDCG
jgi:hypothetical protein